MCVVAVCSGKPVLSVCATYYNLKLYGLCLENNELNLALSFFSPHLCLF